MLTSAGGGAAGTTTPSTASVVDLAGGVPAAGAGAGAGGNFPLGAALLAFAFANFVNVLSIWCALPFPSPPSLSPS